MKALNFKTMAVENTIFQPNQHITKQLTLKEGLSIQELKTDIQAVVDCVKDYKEPALNYVLHCDVLGELSKDYCDIVFEYILHIFHSLFFATITSKERRKDSEYRLDVPEQLFNGAWLSRALLKKAINNETSIDVLRLEVHFKDLIYKLVTE